MKKIAALAIIASLAISNNLFAQSGLHVTKTFHITSDGWWDYISANNGKVYVSHGSQVNILDGKTGDSLGYIPNTRGVHGIAFANEFNKGYTSNGGSGNVTVFDLRTNAILTQVTTDAGPDAIFYDDYSRKIITCNGRGKSLTVIDAATDKVVATIPLGSKPETAVSDGAGKVFINNEDKSSIIVVDINSYKIINEWPIAPGTSPSGLSIDRKTQRLFAGCDNKMLIVIDATDGKVVASVPTGEGCDGTAFDPEWKYIYSSNGEDGTLTVIKEENAGKYTVVENVPTKKGARTCGLDEKSHAVYLPTADFKEAAAGERRAPMVPGSFQVLCVSK
jgi:YVTN family beta-propeller protein